MRTDTEAAFDTIGNKHKKNNCITKVVCVSVLVIIVALSAFFLLMKGDNPEDPNAGKDGKGFDDSEKGPVDEVPENGIPRSTFFKITKDEAKSYYMDPIDGSTPEFTIIHFHGFEQFASEHVDMYNNANFGNGKTRVVIP